MCTNNIVVSDTKMKVSKAADVYHYYFISIEFQIQHIPYLVSVKNKKFAICLSRISTYIFKVSYFNNDFCHYPKMLMITKPQDGG